MSAVAEESVVISNGYSGVTLTPTGPITEVGYPTRIDVIAGPFRVTVVDGTVGGFARFHRDLLDLYGSLSGSARLGSLEGFSLVITGQSLGHMLVQVVAVGSHVPRIVLEFEFEIDQTYLPPLIAGIGRLFPWRRPPRWHLRA
jgi:hypothetical protein